MNTMLVEDLVNEIASDFTDRPPNKLVESKINTIIHIINTIVGKKHELITITGSGDNWEDIDTNWEDIDTNWEDEGRFLKDFTYDTDENKLTIPPTIDRVEKLWVDNELWRPRAYQKVVDSELADQIYCQIGNDIFFSGDMSSETTTMKMQVEMNYPDITEGYVVLAYDFRQTLVSGALMLLATTQKYRDSSMFAVHKGIYESQLDKMRVQSNSSDSAENLNYGSVDNLGRIFETDDYYRPYGG